MPKRIVHHVRRHPWRLAATLGVVLCMSWGLAGYAFYTSLGAAHQGRIDTCVAVNELSRKIYVTLADFGTPVHIRAKFLPTQDCEEIP